MTGGARMGRGRWAPTHRHRKGGLYRVLGEGIWEPDRSPAVIYDDADGTIWLRPAAEFDDGRFTPVTAPEAPAPGGIIARWLGRGGSEP